MFIYLLDRIRIRWEKSSLSSYRYTFRLAPASTNRAPRGALRRAMTAFRVPRRSFAIKHRATAANPLDTRSIKSYVGIEDSWRALSGIETIEHMVEKRYAQLSFNIEHILSSFPFRNSDKNIKIRKQFGPTSSRKHSGVVGRNTIRLVCSLIARVIKGDPRRIHFLPSSV